MKSIKDNLTARNVKKSGGNFRSPFIDEIVLGINAERKNTKFPPVTFKQINGMLAHLKTRTDLHYFCSVARDYKLRGGSYGKFCFGSIKVKKDKK